ncbi:MAG TPA: dihydrofolate reductase family protein [Ktedonobacterales bacterium]
MPSFEPITTLYEREPAPPESLPPILAQAYGGGLTIPAGSTDTRPYVIVNFVETVDGVVSYDLPGKSGGGSISGENDQDHMTMGLLRAAADAVIFGTGSLHGDSGHIRTPDFIYPPFAAEYHTLRRQLGHDQEQPFSVVVSASGHVDLAEPTFHQPGVRALIATTDAGATHLAEQYLPDSTEVFVVPAAPDGGVSPVVLLEVLAREYGVRLALHEGGPALFASFLAANMVDELFLTLAPQFAGRDGHHRLALVEGHAYLPGDAPWSTLLSVKRAGSHLLLRYRLGA